MLKVNFFPTLIQAMIAGIVVAGSPCIAQAESVTTISVQASGDPCPCGSHAGGFDALYGNRKIFINFSYNPNPANPVEHPVKLEPTKLGVCSDANEKCPIADSTIMVSGRWQNKTSFEAYRIELPASYAKNTSFDCSQAKTASDIVICNNADLGQMDKELASLYRSHLKDYEHDPKIVKKLHGTQISWLTERNRCGSDVLCLRARYQERIAWLHEFEAYD